MKNIYKQNTNLDAIILIVTNNIYNIYTYEQLRGCVDKRYNSYGIPLELYRLSTQSLNSI